MKKMPGGIVRMMGQDPPSDWLCNASKKHDPVDEEMCHCVGCIKRAYPYLQEGDPQQTNKGNDAWDQEALIKDGYVGIYDPSLRTKEVVSESVEGNNKAMGGGDNGRG